MHSRGVQDVIRVRDSQRRRGVAEHAWPERAVRAGAVVVVVGVRLQKLRSGFHGAAVARANGAHQRARFPRTEAGDVPQRVLFPRVRRRGVYVNAALVHHVHERALENGGLLFLR